MWRNVIVLAALVLGLACIALVVSTGAGTRAVGIGKPVLVADVVPEFGAAP